MQSEGNLYSFFLLLPFATSQRAIVNVAVGALEQDL